MSVSGHMRIPFNEMPEVKFQRGMKPAALSIYRRVFPGSRIEDLRETGVNVHILDQEFGIDALLHLSSGQWISIQEKYRRYRYLRYADFTMEYMNAVGTPFEGPGEWFKLGAQLYFYGWANETETDFEKWAIINIPEFKALVERKGGLEKMGSLKQNSRAGRASFYAIKMKDLRPAFFATYLDFSPSETAHIELPIGPVL